MTSEGRHWTLEDYVEAIVRAGLRIDALPEIPDLEDPRWSRYPLFLHVRAVRGKASQPG